LYCTKSGKIIVSNETRTIKGQLCLRTVVIDKKTLTLVDDLDNNHLNVHHDTYKSWFSKSVNYLMTVDSLKQIDKNLLKIMVEYVY